MSFSDAPLRSARYPLYNVMTNPTIFAAQVSGMVPAQCLGNFGECALLCKMLVSGRSPLGNSGQPTAGQDHTIGARTAQTNSRSSIERQVAPGRKDWILVEGHFRVFPSLGPKVVRVLSVQILSTMHYIDTICNILPFTYEYWRCAVGTTAGRKRCRFECCPSVDGY